MRGWHYTRLSENPLAGRTLFGKPYPGSLYTVEYMRQLGWQIVIGAPVLWLLLAAMAFGWVPATDVEPIKII